MATTFTLNLESFDDPRIHAVLNLQSLPFPCYFEYHSSPIIHAERNAAFYLLLVHELRPIPSALWPVQQVVGIIQRLQACHDNPAQSRLLIAFYKCLFQLLTGPDYDDVCYEQTG